MTNSDDFTVLAQPIEAFNAYMAVFSLCAMGFQRQYALVTELQSLRQAIPAPASREETPATT